MSRQIPKKMLVLPTIIALTLLTLSAFTPAVMAAIPADPLQPYAHAPNVLSSHFTSTTGQLVVKTPEGVAILRWNVSSPDVIQFKVEGQNGMMPVNPASAMGTDWSWGCGWFGCHISFNVAESNEFLNLVNIWGPVAAAATIFLSVLKIVGAIASAVFGFFITLGVAAIATLAYYCVNWPHQGFYMGASLFGGIVAGCNPVPWYV